MDAYHLFNERPAAAAGWEDDSDTAWAEFQMLAADWLAPGTPAKAASRADKLPSRERGHPAIA